MSEVLFCNVKSSTSACIQRRMEGSPGTCLLTFLLSCSREFLSFTVDIQSDLWSDLCCWENSIFWRTNRNPQCKAMRLPYKDTLSCPSLLDADRGLETPGPETKGVMTLGTVSSLSFKFPSIPFIFLSPWRAMCVAQVGIQAVCLTLGEGWGDKVVLTCM